MLRRLSRPGYEAEDVIASTSTEGSVLWRRSRPGGGFAKLTHNSIVDTQLNSRGGDLLFADLVPVIGGRLENRAVEVPDDQS